MTTKQIHFSNNNIDFNTQNKFNNLVKVNKS